MRQCISGMELLCFAAKQAVPGSSKPVNNKTANKLREAECLCVISIPSMCRVNLSGNCKTSEVLAAPNLTPISYAPNFLRGSFQCVRIADPTLPCCSHFRFSAIGVDIGCIFSFPLDPAAL